MTKAEKRGLRVSGTIRKQPLTGGAEAQVGPQTGLMKQPLLKKVKQKHRGKIGGLGQR